MDFAANFGITKWDYVMTSGHIEELDNKGRLLEDEYSYYGVTDKERDRMGEMCDPYEGL